MSIDRKTRNDLKNALVSYMTGEIRSFAFDDTVSPCLLAKSTEDKSIRQIARFLWSMYDDLIDHPISVTPEGWAALRRTVAFLCTDLEIEKPSDRDAWPYRDQEQWLANEMLLVDIALPDYAPDIHGRPANPWWNRIPTSVGLAIIAAPLVLGFLLLLFRR